MKHHYLVTAGGGAEPARGCRGVKRISPRGKGRLTPMRLAGRSRACAVTNSVVGDGAPGLEYRPWVRWPMHAGTS